MEEKIKELREKSLLETFIEAFIKWHTRKGFRDCTCNFCIEKKAGTRYIGYTPFPFVKFQEELGRLRQIPCHSLEVEDIAKDIVNRERKRKRKEVRERLNRAKEEIL